MKSTTIPLKDRAEFKRRLLMSIGKGRQQAITGKELAYHCRYDADGSDRMTRKMIGLLIEEGYPIAASTSKPMGYYLAETKQEVNDYAQTIRSRLIKDAIRRRDFLRASRVILQPEQMKMGV